MVNESKIISTRNFRSRFWIIAFTVLISTGELFAGSSNLENPLDNELEIRPEADILISKIGAAKVMLTPARFVNYISRCKRFPKNIEDMYREHEGVAKGCRPFPILLINPMAPFGGEVWPWIDPWGRPYQIRYDRERRKLQVRSRGRDLNSDDDDIEAETTWGTAGIYFNAEIKRCEKLSKNNESCILNRGWH